MVRDYFQRGISLLPLPAGEGRGEGGPLSILNSYLTGSSRGE